MTDDRVSNKNLTKIRSRLSERDLAILGAVAEHQFLTTRQLMRLHFHSHQSDASGIRATNRVLNRLLDQRVLGRLERVVGGVRAGSSSFVWCLDVVGDRLNRIETGAARRRFFEPSMTFLGHKLAVAEARIVIEETAREQQLELLALDIESHSWRPYLGRGGETVRLKPDLSVVVATDHHEYHWFVEVDQGTESFRTLLEKCLAYEQYRRTGREQANHGLFPRVLWIMPTLSRADQLRKHIAETKALDAALFSVVTPGELPSVFADLEGLE